MGTKKLTEDELKELFARARAYAIAYVGPGDYAAAPIGGYLIAINFRRTDGGWMVIESKPKHARNRHKRTVYPPSKPPRSLKFEGVGNQGDLKVTCYSQAACRKVIKLLDAHFVLDTLAKV